MCVPRGASHERSLPDMPCPSHPLDMAGSWSPNPFLSRPERIRSFNSAQTALQQPPLITDHPEEAT